MTHYKLDLVCQKCFCCPSVTSEAFWCTTAGRAASCPWKEAPTNHLCCSLARSTRYAGPTLQRQEPGQRIGRRIQHPCGTATLEIHPWPIGVDLERGSDIHVNLMHTYHLNLLASHSDPSNVRMSPLHALAPSCCIWWSGYCHPRIQCEPAVPHSWYQIQPPHSSASPVRALQNGPFMLQETGGAVTVIQEFNMNLQIPHSLSATLPVGP